MIKLFYALLFMFVLGSCMDNNSDLSDPLQTGFMDPPTSAKPKGYWCLVNGNFDLTQMTNELREYKAKGVGTLDIWDVAGWVDENNVVPAGPPFMSDKSVQAIAHAIREAGKIGIDIGLTISSSWNAGGDWVQPEDGVMGLFKSSISVEGPIKIVREIAFPDIPEKFKHIDMILYKDENGLPTFYREVALLAYQFSNDSVITDLVDLSDFFIDGKVNWDVPKGTWEISRYVCTGTGQPLMRPSPNSNGLMIDHFSADAMKKHLNYFFDKLEAELGDLSKTALQYLYTDSYEANSAVWTVKMVEEFKERVGYSLIEYLPALQGFVINDKDSTNRFLFDYRKVLSDLIIQNHYELGRKICEEKNIEFIAEAGGPGPPIHNCPFESLSSLGKLSAPRGEFWFDTMWNREKIDGLQIVKGPASAAHLYDRPRVEAEAFTGTQIWQFGPGDLKSTADRAMCEGLTSFVYHTSPHIPREAGIPGWVYNFGTIINTTRAWWPLSEGFHNYLGRSCFLLQQGNFVGDVLYYYGDQAPNFVKPKSIDPSLGFGYDYDVVNSDIILNRLDLVDGYYSLPHGQRYKVLVLPDSKSMNPSVLKRISKLVEKGGILVGDPPSKSHSLYKAEKNDQHIEELSKFLWKGGKTKNKFGEGFVFSKKMALREIMNDLGIMPDVAISKKNPERFIDFIHRETETADIYFIRNVTDTEQVYNLTLRSVKGPPELWDPSNSTISTIQLYSQNESASRFPLKFQPFGSVFIIFREGGSVRQIKNVTKDDRQIFPIANDYFPISYSANDIIFEDNGEYLFEYSNGDTENYSVENNNQTELSGEWEIRFPHGWGAPFRTEFDELISWTESEDPGIKYFSGIAEYHKSFHFSEISDDLKIVLDLGAVSKIAKIYLNGYDLGTKWFSPYIFDITNHVKSGNNNLVIEVANVRSNQMVGDSFRQGREKRTHSNITRGPNAWMTEYKDLKLIESGLLGPVRIIIQKRSQ